MLSQARDLASSHGYTVLQAVQEWHSSKGSSKAMPLGEVIEKFLAAKSNRSPAYMDKLNADMRLFQSHFGGERPEALADGRIVLRRVETHHHLIEVTVVPCELNGSR